jgi:hypothetical protein
MARLRTVLVLFLLMAGATCATAADLVSVPVMDGRMLPTNTSAAFTVTQTDGIVTRRAYWSGNSVEVNGSIPVGSTFPSTTATLNWVIATSDGGFDWNQVDGTMAWDPYAVFITFSYDPNKVSTTHYPMGPIPKGAEIGPAPVPR